ncbi:hypothetical protein POM88_018107 [Heracleum sosnowskyi]|uniref:Uncharacterized protein n=1 Tax=Heracleum sosnowskyi TaxID=360622 RepID=A0AAD8MYL4_9APIA|nr:hypothetical protein POM88_018107 [Heracleum sosnowskyi]
MGINALILLIALVLLLNYSSTAENPRKMRNLRAPTGFASGFRKWGSMEVVWCFFLVCMLVITISALMGRVGDRGKGKKKASAANTSRRKRTRTSGRLRDEPEEEDGEEEQPSNVNEDVDEEERRLLVVQQEAARRARIIATPIRRTHSIGIWGNPPPTPHPISISDGHIKNPVAKKTILQIMRSTWPHGLFTYRQIVAGNPKWITDVITEFNNYYTHKGEQTEQGAYESIYKHVQSEMKHTLNETKKKAKADAKQLNKTLFEVNPGIFDDDFWKELVEYWMSKAHGHLSEVGSKNREKIKNLHSAGAKSFTEMEDVCWKETPQLWWYKKTHLKKNGKRVEIDELPCDSDFMTEESRLIAARYADIVERNRDWFASQPGGEEEATHPLQWWIEATAPGCARPPRNQLIGFPRIPASTLIPDLAANYRAQRVGGAGSSSQANQGSESVIPDPLFINVVRNVLNEAQANPGAYHTPPTFAQVSNIANAALEMQRNPEMGSQAFSNAIVGEVTRLVGEILQSIYNKYENANAEAIRRAQGGADDGGEDDGGEDNGGGEGDGQDDGGYRDDGIIDYTNQGFNRLLQLGLN